MSRNFVLFLGKVNFRVVIPELSPVVGPGLGWVVLLGGRLLLVLCVLLWCSSVQFEFQCVCVMCVLCAVCVC